MTDDLRVYPISNLEDLFSWSFPEDLKKPLAAVSELQPRSKGISLTTGQAPEKTFKTLICHDMANGYHEDGFVYGSKDDSAYRFYHWSGIDSFVYFSHHFVTIPPVGWVEAAHTNGVKMLGTFITEWNRGEKIWQEILESAEKLDVITSLLVEIAVAYKFDGWLLNVENKMEKTKVNMLLTFVQELTKKMHGAKKDSEIIWYDSVTVEGDLKWQNELNHLNRAFFDHCDGIFLNYTWDEECLISSLKEAGERRVDVYVGLDIWGRNFYEGGGYNTHLAMDLVRKNNLSAAIFAQAWTYQALGGAYNYFSNENSFWKDLSPYLLVHGPAKFPIKTAFCQGFGKHLFFDGMVIKDDSWFNLWKQSLQPLWEEFSRRQKHFSLSTDAAFNGGSSVSVWFDKVESVRMLVCDVPVTKGLEIKLVYKTTNLLKYVALRLSLLVQEPNRASRMLQLFFICQLQEDYKLPKEPEHEHIEESVKDEKNGWQIRTFSWKNDSLIGRSDLRDIRLCCEGPGVLRIGQLTLEEI